MPSPAPHGCKCVQLIAVNRRLQWPFPVKLLIHRACWKRRWSGVPAGPAPQIYTSPGDQQPFGCHAAVVVAKHVGAMVGAFATADGASSASVPLIKACPGFDITPECRLAAVTTSMWWRLVRDGSDDFLAPGF